MRITGGTLKNRRIHIPKTGHNIRPTADKMRQAIFNMLDHAPWGMTLEGMTMLDGFCGSGIMGIEALSRGAEHVIFVDQDRAALQRLQSTLHHDLKIEQSVYQCVSMDLSKARALSKQCDLVFLDPPYGKGLVAAALLALAKQNALKHEALCMCEVEKGALVSLPSANFEMLDERKYGDSKLVILRYKATIE